MWWRELLALVVGAIFLAVCQISVYEADCRAQEESGEPVATFTGAEIDQVLATGELSAEHCLWMHENKISWEVSVERS